MATFQLSFDSTRGRQVLPDLSTDAKKIDLITQITLDINGVKDVDFLLEKILTNVRRFFNADAGSIYLKQGDELRFSYIQIHQNISHISDTQILD